MYENPAPMLNTTEPRKRIKDQDAFVPTDLTPEQRQRWGMYALMEYGEGRAPHYWRKIGAARDRMIILIDECKKDNNPVPENLRSAFRECDGRQTDLRAKVLHAESKAEEWGGEPDVDYAELATMFEERFKRVIFGEAAMHIHARGGELPTRDDPGEFAKEKLVEVWGESPDLK